jgi:PAT family beta-lactamase induction signal transducer AmpG
MPQPVHGPTAAPAVRDRLPALTEHTALRYFAFVALYVAQGVPEGMTYFGIPAWMAMHGKSPAEVGSFVGVVGIPWSFKLLVAPLMDRFTFLPMGRRRPWVLFGQLGLIASFISLALVPDPLNNMTGLMTAAFFVSVFGATQDVATDGMAVDVVPVNQQARANGLMWGSKTIGTSVSLVAGTWLIGRFGFQVAILSLAVSVCLIMFVPLLLRERRGERLLPWTSGEASPQAARLQLDSWGPIFRSLVKVFFLPASFFMGVAVFAIHIGFGLMDTLLPVFTIQSAGWTDAGYASVFSAANVAAGLLGMVAGGVLADVFGKRRVMTAYLLCIVVLVTTMTLGKEWWNTPFVITAFIGLYYTLYVFLTVAIFATGMELCWSRVAATQFTLYMAIANMGRATGAGLLGPLQSALPWEYVILTVAGFALAMLILVQLIRMKPHLDRLDVLEADHLELEATRAVQVPV